MDSLSGDEFVCSSMMQDLSASMSASQGSGAYADLAADDEIVIRRAELADIPQIIDLASEMAIHSMSPFRRPGQELVIESRREDLQSLYQQWWSTDLGIFVASNSQGDILGHVMVKIGCKEFLTGEEQAWIFDIAVDPEFWGTGLAKRLLDAAENFAQERGMCYMGLTVTCSNLRAVKFYQNEGYQDERAQMVKILNPGFVPEEI